jgi:ammonium transporter, Amt family
VGRQFAEITAISAYSFLVSCALLLIMKYIPGLHLRISDEAEEKGLDLDHFFEEEIGDWSLAHEFARSQHTTTILGEVPAKATSSTEAVQETKTSAADNTSSN